MTDGPQFWMIPNAPTPVAPFSHASESGGWVFLTGQMPTSPDDDAAPLPEGVVAQTRRVMDNITAILKAESLTCDNVAKTTIFLADLGDFQTVNEIYGSYFKQAPPARSTVQVAALPKGARVEIEVIAVAGDADQTAADTSG